MTWQRQNNGGRIYHELPESILQLEGQTISPGSTRSFNIPWGNDGFTRGQFACELTSTDVFALELFVRGMSSDIAKATIIPFSPGNVGQTDISLSGPIPATVLGTSKLVITFFDGPLPGNLWYQDGAGAIVSRSNALNPTILTNPAALQLTFLADAGNPQNITINNASVILSGDGGHNGK